MNLFSKLTLTLETCLFPFLYRTIHTNKHRVIFCAQAPYTVVHTNAAYTTLVQLGLTKSCIVGETFGGYTNNNEHQAAKEEDGTPEECIARIVSEHVVATATTDNNSPPLSSFTSSKSAVRPIGGVVGKKNIHIFPILSNDDTCSQFIRSYQSNWLQRQRSAADNNNNNNNNKKPDASNAASQVLTLNSPGHLQHHSRGGGNNGGSSSSSSQYVSHYLLQIEPIKGKVLQLKH